MISRLGNQGRSVVGLHEVWGGRELLLPTRGLDEPHSAFVRKTHFGSVVGEFRLRHGVEYRA